MTSAEIIAIGTELLLGETQDTNTQFLARELNKAGIELFRTAIIGDNQKRITQSIIESLARTEIVITTGGLGPTIDDPTRQAVADVFNENLVFKQILWETIKKRFERSGRTPTKNNRRQAYIPKSARVIENPVGTAPAFYVAKDQNLLICLPGVPAELKYLFEYSVLSLIFSKYPIRQTILSLIIHTIGLGESKVDELIEDLEKMDNPTVGLTAYPGQVDIRITAKAANEETANKLILPILNELGKRLGNNIFGQGDEKLSEKVRLIKEKTKKNLILFINNCSEELITEISQTGVFDQVIIKTTDSIFLENEIQTMYNIPSDYSAGIDLEVNEDRKTLQIVMIISNKEIIKETKNFSGHDSLVSQWAFNMFFDFLRRNLS
jgi:nicotinamide-nucleotide amidase